MLDNSEFPKWDTTNQADSLMLVYQWTVNKALERIAWYDEKKKPKRMGSRLLRCLSILLAAAGALCPLIDATGILGIGQNKIALGQWGYVFLALAAAIVGFDKYFGMSTGWMRFIVTQLSLERSLQEFQYDWAILSAQQQKEEPQKAIMPALLQRLKDFSLQVENLIKKETDAWVVEFQSNIAELNKVLKAEVETKRPGSIKIAITNAKDFEKVLILLNDTEVKEFVGVSEGLIDSVPPRRYEVKAIGRKDHREYKESKVVEVQPNSMASVELTLRSS